MGVQTPGRCFLIKEDIIYLYKSSGKKWRKWNIIRLLTINYLVTEEGKTQPEMNAWAHLVMLLSKHKYMVSEREPEAYRLLSWK